MALKATKQDTKTYTASQAREHFSKILDAVEQGEEVVITKHGVAIAMIMRPRKDKKHAIPAPGFLRDEGWSVEMSEDFDAVPEGFEDYV